MCLAPIRTVHGEVACRDCRLCRDNRVNDFVGRAIAESRQSLLSVVLTLTYGGGDHADASVLNYNHFQNFMKKLRKKYHVRFICAGEYGTEKSRAHWHVCLFFNGTKTPLIKMPTFKWYTEQWTWPDWEHGYTFAEKPTYKEFRYAVKYCIKSEKDTQSSRQFSTSKLPPLGHEYFRDLAERYVAQRISPRDYSYSFDDTFDTNEKRRVFYMSGKTRDNFIDHFYQTWIKKHGLMMPFTELMDEYTDKKLYAKRWYTDMQFIKKMRESNPHWTMPDKKEPSTKKWMTPNHGCIERIPNGRYNYLQYNYLGELQWVRLIESAAEEKLALLGTLPQITTQH